MSETVHFKGRLTKVFIENNLEETCEKIMEGEELPSYYESFGTFLEDERHEEYVILENILYKITNLKEFVMDEEIFQAHKNEDGTIDFEMKYYNGGCGFQEGIGCAVDKLSVDS